MFLRMVSDYNFNPDLKFILSIKTIGHILRNRNRLPNVNNGYVRMTICFCSVLAGPSVRVWPRTEFRSQV